MAPQIRDIAITEIETGDRLRAADGAWIGQLMDSISQNGLLAPIVLRPIRKVGKRPFELLAGMHRLAACTSLGWQTLPCMVVAADDQQALLTQIDENIVRHELNVLDRAMALVERQAIYEALHPETKKGGDRKSAEYQDKNQTDNLSVWSFAKDAAEKTGMDERSIRRATKLAKGLRPETRARLAGTDLADNQAALTQISDLQAAEQHGVLDLMLRDEAPIRKVSDALAQVQGRALGRERTPGEKQLASFIHLWGRAGVKTRREIIRLVKEYDVEDIDVEKEGLGDV